MRRATGVQPERERNYFPPGREKEALVGRSLPVLNAPEQRLSEVPLTRTRPIRTLASKCARKHTSRARICLLLAVYITRRRVAWRYGRAGTMRFRLCLYCEDRQRHWQRFHYRYEKMRLTSHYGNNTPMRHASARTERVHQVPTFWCNVRCDVGEERVAQRPRKSRYPCFSNMRSIRGLHLEHLEKRAAKSTIIISKLSENIAEQIVELNSKSTYLKKIKNITQCVLVV